MDDEGVCINAQKIAVYKDGENIRAVAGYLRINLFSERTMNYTGSKEHKEGLHKMLTARIFNLSA